MGQVRNRKAARYGKLPSTWKRSAIAIGVAAVLACVGLPAYAQKVELGPNTSADVDGTTIGARAQTVGDGGTALGMEAKALADRATAIGRRAEARAIDSLALGAGAIVNATATGSIALGAGSVATGSTLATPSYLLNTTATKELAIGNRRITGVAAGANNDDAATVGQLKAANVGNDLAVRYVWNDANNDRIVDPGEVDYNKVVMGGTAYNPATKTGGTAISNVARGVVAANSSDAVNGSQLYEVDKRASAGWNLSAQGANTTNVAPGESVDLNNSDTNIVITKNAASDNVTFNLDPTLDLGPSGSVTMGTTAVNANGMTIAGGPSVVLTGIDAGSKKISNVADGSVALGSKEAVNGSQLADVDKRASAGWNLSAQGANKTNVAPGESVDLKNTDGNIVVTKGSASDDVTFNLDTTLDLGPSGSVTMGATAVNANGMTITGGPSVVLAGIDAGSKKISNVADGAVALGSKDAVNGSQLADVDKRASAGWNLSAQGANTTNVAPGESVNLSNTDGNILVTKSAASDDVTFNLDTTLDLGPSGSVTMGATAVNANGMTITGGPSVVLAGIDAGSKKVSNVADGAVALGSKDAVNGSQLYAVDQRVSAGWNLSAQGANKTNVAAGESVDLNNTDGNIVVTKGSASDDVTFNLDTTLDLGPSGSVAMGNTTVNSTGMTITGGPSVTTTGINAGDMKITNVATGTVDAGSEDAVNGGQLYGASASVANALGGGAGVAADGSVTLPNYALTKANSIGGTTGAATNVGEGFDKVDNALGVLNSNIADITNGNAGINYFHVNSTDVDSSATGSEAIAIGPRAQGNGWFGVAMGSDARAIGDASTAIGSGAWAYGYESTAVGFYAEARGNLSAAFGSALAFGEGTTALGTWAYAGGGFDWTGAGGRPGNIVEIKNGTAVGFSSVAAADNATALGAEAEARGEGSLAMGSAAQATGIASIAAGEGAMAVADNSVALGAGAVASDVVGTASTEINGEIYNFAGTAPTGTVSVGSPGSERTITNLAAGRIEAASTDAVNGSQLYATNQAIETISGVAGNANDLAVKYGWNDANGDGIATQDEIDYSTVTLQGSKGTTIDNVAPAFLDPGSMQAVNGAQLFQSMDQVAMMLGGGAAMTANGLTAPSYFIQGSVYNDVGSALQALDISISTLDGRPVGSQLVGYTHGHDGNPYGDGGPGSTALGVGATALGAEESVALGESATVAADYGTAVGQKATVTADNAVALGHGSVADRANAVSVGSVGSERQVTNVADATQGTDAINKRQLDRGVASANSYTDARVNALSDNFDQFQGAVDERLRKQDDRIDRQGAMSAAMMNMAVSAAGLHTPNRFGVGVGFQGGESALSLGYQRAFSDRATLTFGGAVSSDDTSVGVGAGFGW